MSSVFTFEGIGTSWSLEVYDRYLTHELQERLLARVEEFDRTYSRFRSDSLVTAIARKAGEYVFPEDANELFRAYEEWYRLTDGLVTPLIGRSLEQAGYDAQYSLKPESVTTPPRWDDVLAWESPSLVTNEPLVLDFGAAGKGYLVDILAEMLEAERIRAYTLDASGDMRHRSGEPLEVGLENPDNVTEAIGIALLDNRSLCGSAGNRRVWAGYHHILNPHTRQSPRHIKAVWTVADSTLLADGLSTCLYFVEPSQLSSYDFEYAIVYADGSLESSPSFPAEFFTA